MTHGSLFSGIGGFDLAAEWMGWQNVFHCEWNPFGQKVLKHYWPDAELFTDITKSNFTKYAGTIDIISGGFPCQPYSAAGKRKGKEDERHLWPEMLRTIREVQPRWVVGENVLGLVNWSGGLVFHEVQADLEAAGYEVWPYVLAAASVGAPHRRDRVWFVAHAEHLRFKQCEQQEQPRCGERLFKGLRNNGNAPDTGLFGQAKSRKPTMGVEQLHEGGDATDPHGNGCNERNCKHEKQSSERGFNAFGHTNECNDNGDAPDTVQSRRREDNRERKSKFFDENGKIGNWEKFPTQSPVRGRNDGISDGLDGITFSKWRNESIKAYGNAVVPQVVYQIFKAIEQYENLNP